MNNTNRFQIITLLLLLFLFSGSWSVYSQNSYEHPLVLDFFESLYRYDFTESRKKLEKLNEELKTKPEAQLSSANFYWWEMMSGNNDDLPEKEFNRANQSIISRYQNTKPSALSADELFAVIHAYAYETRFELHKKNYIPGLANLKRILPFLEKLLEDPEKTEKFTLIAGLYHYAAAVTIEERPLLRLFFSGAPSCDRQFGYQLLLKAAKSPHPLIAMEAKYFLMKINLEISKSYSEALKWSTKLVVSYPENILYRYYLLEILAKSGRSEDMEREFTRIQSLSAILPGISGKQKIHFVNRAERLVKKHK